MSTYTYSLLLNLIFYLINGSKLLVRILRHHNMYPMFFLAINSLIFIQPDKFQGWHHYFCVNEVLNCNNIFMEHQIESNFLSFENQIILHVCFYLVFQMILFL
jgi:hypothetical protein